jgi:hypothetical protein
MRSDIHQGLDDDIMSRTPQDAMEKMRRPTAFGGHTLLATLQFVATREQLVVETSPTVLLLAYMFQPLNCFAVELFLNSDVRHGRRRRGSVPMLLSRREPHDIARVDFFDGSAPALRATAAGGYDKRLA